MALIKCNECGKEISDQATTCPNCGAPVRPVNSSPAEKNTKAKPDKKKGSCLKTILIILAVLIVIGIIGSALGGDDDEVKDVTSESSNTSQAVTDTEAKDALEEKTEFSVGETAEYKDVQVSVLNYEESSGNDWGTPEDGNVFVYLNIEIANNSDEEISVSSLLSFEGYCDDYKLDFSSNALLAMSTEDMQQLDGNIAPGKKLNGYLGVEVPADWNTLEVYYKDNVWSDSNFKFVITK